MATTATQIDLYLPFYTPDDPQRAAELLHCLEKNLANSAFHHVYLLQDDDTPLPFDNAKLKVLPLDRRPSYRDWVKLSCENGSGRISVLANSDIYFDESILLLQDLLLPDERRFVALSRYDKKAETVTPHPNPHWSQDTWAFRPANNIPLSMMKSLDFPLGVPRCDNKVAYVFSINAFDVYNPIKDIQTVHVHETELRYYDKKGDTSIKGGVAMVHPCPNLQEPSKLDIEIWSEKSEDYNSVRLNKSLEKWSQERDTETRSNRVFGHDSDWQYPAITEKHAFIKSQELFQGTSKNFAYLGFPWATLFDLNTHARHRSDAIEKLREALSNLSSQIRGFDRVVTTCQHIRLLENMEFFQQSGITDIFWSHKILGQDALPKHPNISLHSFPLYPVQQSDDDWDDFDAERPFLFSFIGAKANDNYMSDVRNRILEIFRTHPKAKIVDRETWHYNKVVYDKQILDRTKEQSDLQDSEAEKQFLSVMSDSTFTLCPSGSGPNSIRLWEAISNNSIPVVISDHYDPPGDHRLWNLATVSCSEDDNSLRSLPEKLQNIADDQTQLKRMRLGLKFLAQKYGPQYFVHDIVKLARNDG